MAQARPGERPLTYQEFLTYSREQARVAQVDRDRIAKLEARLRDLTEQLAAHIGAERIAEISSERKVA